MFGNRMTEPIEDKPNLTVDDMGWTVEYALSIRAKFASVLEDWDDPEMDIYNDASDGEADA